MPLERLGGCEWTWKHSGGGAGGQEREREEEEETNLLASPGEKVERMENEREQQLHPPTTPLRVSLIRQDAQQLLIPVEDVPEKEREKKREKRGQ